MKQSLIGLSSDQVVNNRKKFGKNHITPPQKPSLFLLFIEKFKDPIIIILLIATALSFVIAIIENEYAETIGIVVAILLATGIGFWFEMDANKKFDVLNKINDEVFFKVIRNGHITQVVKQDIVVEDIVMLETGEEFPADAILLEAISLQVNESSLTGELLVNKTTNPDFFNINDTYPSNFVYRGTTIVNGHCTIKVTAVGDQTEFGKVAQKSTEINNDKTPLTKQLDRLAKFISMVGFIVAGLVFISFLLKDILSESITLSNLFAITTLEHLLRYFMVAVTLIVVSVPEGLPMSVSLSLALSMRKMLQTNNLVRKMHACETMGATTVICTDKTGTLTQNKMQVVQCNLYPFSSCTLPLNNPLSILLAKTIAINSTAFLEFSSDNAVHLLGNPTEAALLLWLYDHGYAYEDFRVDAEIIAQLPFSTEHKFMSTQVKESNQYIVYCKGAPEIILSKCTEVLTPEGLQSLDIHRTAIEQELLAYQNKAMRTLALAYKINKTAVNELLQDSGYTLLAIFGISDPIRNDVPQAVKDCIKAGVEIKIVTGDTFATAREIGCQIGIFDKGNLNEQIISGQEFEALPDNEVIQRLHQLKIMCRARPMDKQRLVKLLKHQNEVVAVTGDGTNDAPALNAADVGLSMGSGTTVAKEASDITLIDDSFKSIETAIMWGRSLYHNIQRFILFQLTINLTALLIVLIGSIMGKELPLTVTQMLWVNLIIDTFAAIALASLPPNKNVMNEKPRKNTDFIISPLMRRHIIGTAILFTVVLLGLLEWFMIVDGEITRYHLSIFFTSFVMLQFWNLFNAKAFLAHTSAFKDIAKAKGFLTILFVIPIGQLLIVQFGGTVFRTTPLSFLHWIYIILGTSSILWLNELRILLHKKNVV